MGIHDRDYYREPRGGLTLRLPSTIVGSIIAVNLAIFGVDVLIFGGKLSEFLAVHAPRPPEARAPLGAGGYPSTLTTPWMWWQFITYGVAHSPNEIRHILFNMLALFFLGRDVEAAYGRKEFLRLYLVLLAAGGIAWALLNMQTPSGALVIGASGAIAGVVVLFALNFPHRTLLLFFVIPVPAWVVGVLLVVFDVLGAMGGDVGGRGGNIAYSVHLTGAALALLYYSQRWRFERMTRWPSQWLAKLRQPRLRVHHPPDGDGSDEAPSSTDDAEVDRILQKIYREGEASLTRKERQTRQEASRQFQQRRR